MHINLHRNNYPEHITLAPRNLDRRIENNTRKLTTVCLPYVKGLSKRYVVHMTSGQYSHGQTYCGELKKSHQRNSKWTRTVYSIPCSCAKIYKGDTGRTLKGRLEEHWKAVVRGEIEKSDMVDHIWKEKGNYLPLWDEVEIIDRAEHWRIRRLKESAHMLGYNDLLSRPSIEINTIWELIIKKIRLKKKSEYEHR